MLTILSLMLLVNKGISCWPISERTYLSSITRPKPVRRFDPLMKLKCLALHYKICVTLTWLNFKTKTRIFGWSRIWSMTGPNRCQGSMCKPKAPRSRIFGLNVLTFKIQWVALLRRWRNQGVLDEWQIVAPQTIHTCIFQACRHHKLTADQGMVHSFDQALVLLA